MRRLALLCLAGFFALTTVASATEVQGWRTSNDHIHTDVPNLAQLSTLSSPLSLGVTTLLHNRAGGKLTFVRWSDQGDIKQVVSMSVVGTGAPEQKITTILRFDPSLFAHSGFQETHVTSNFVDTNGHREFTTTRLCLFIVNGKSRSDYCASGTPTAPTSAGRVGGGAWYAATAYSVAFVDARDVATSQRRPLKAGDVVRVRAQAGSVNVAIDPHFHAGDPGRTLLTNGGTSWRSVTIPSGLATGAHVLHIRDQRSNGEAGVYNMPFTVQNVVEAPKPACSDGLDNDGDLLVDSSDPGCSSTTDDSEVDPVPVPTDTDADGVADNLDQCPALSGLRTDGCPNPAQTIALAAERDELLRRLTELQAPAFTL